jgi:hypothetical protein
MPLKKKNSMPFIQNLFQFYVIEKNKIKIKKKINSLSEISNIFL